MKKFFTKLKNFFGKLIPTRRRIIQLYTALLYNANIKGFISGKISTAGTKNICVPGFNCYSCPGAVGSCPLGSLQNALGSGKTGTISYVLGILMLFGLILGRTICGFLCPMGLAQDLLYKIKSPKAKKSKFTRILSYFKYVLLLAFVIIVPLVYSGVVVLPSFCQYICPVGTVSGLALLANPQNAGELVALGVLFTWKICVAVLIFIGSIFVFRLFCRFFCPLGAIYSLFSRFALLGVKLDDHKCVDCGLCVKTCKVDIKRVGDHECIQCGECIGVCPTKAISWKGSGFFIAPNEIEPSQTKPKETQETLEIQDETPPLLTQKAKNETDFKTPPLYALRKNNGKGFKIISCVLATVLLLSALVYFNFIHKETEADTSFKVGDVMPNFEAKEFFSADGKYSLEEDKGKVVVLNFWYIGCGGCEKEMPHFGALAVDEKYKDKVSVVVVHSSDEVHEAEKLVDYDGNTIPYIEKYILEDKNQSTVEGQKWNVFTNSIKWIKDLDEEKSLYLTIGGSGAWPMTAILDGEGVVRFITSSSVTEEILYYEVDKILDENP